MEPKTTITVQSDGKKQERDLKPYCSPKVTEHGTVQDMTLGTVNGTAPAADAQFNLS